MRQKPTPLSSIPRVGVHRCRSWWWAKNGAVNSPLRARGVFSRLGEEGAKAAGPDHADDATVVPGFRTMHAAPGTECAAVRSGGHSPCRQPRPGRPSRWRPEVPHPRQHLSNRCRSCVTSCRTPPRRPNRRCWPTRATTACASAALCRSGGFDRSIPARRCIPAEQAAGELYAQDAALQRKRYVVERTLGWLKGFRRLRYRVDRTAASFQAFVYLAVLVLCVRRLVGGNPDKKLAASCPTQWAWPASPRSRPLGCRPAVAP